MEIMAFFEGCTRGFQLHSSQASICCFIYIYIYKYRYIFSRTICRPTAQRYTIHLHHPTHPGIFCLSGGVFSHCILSGVIYLAAQIWFFAAGAASRFSVSTETFLTVTWPKPTESWCWSITRTRARSWTFVHFNVKGPSLGSLVCTFGEGPKQTNNIWQDTLGSLNTPGIPLKNPKDLPPWNYQALVLQKKPCFSLAMVSILFWHVMNSRIILRARLSRESRRQGSSTWVKLLGHWQGFFAMISLSHVW